jgi:hypothetical protein
MSAKQVRKGNRDVMSSALGLLQRFRYMLGYAIGCSILVLFSAHTGRAQEAQQKVFTTAHAAVTAFVNASRSDVVSALLEILGPEG